MRGPTGTPAATPLGDTPQALAPLLAHPPKPRPKAENSRKATEKDDIIDKRPIDKDDPKIQTRKNIGKRSRSRRGSARMGPYRGGIVGFRVFRVIVGGIHAKKLESILRHLRINRRRDL